MHETWQSQLPHYVAGTLTASDRDALEAHLRECAACRAAAQTWTLIAEAVQAESVGRADGLPPLRLPPEAHPARAVRNGRSPAPSEDDVFAQPMEGSPMTLHEMTAHKLTMTVPEIATLHPAPPRYGPQNARRTRAPIMLIAAVLLSVFVGLGALLLMSRQDGGADPAGPQPGDEQPLGLGLQAATETPFVVSPTPQTSPTAVHLSAPQMMTAAALLESYNATMNALGGPANEASATPLLPPQMTSTALLESYYATQRAMQGLAVDATATPTPVIGVPSVIPEALPERAAIEGIHFENQTWNNSAPAALAMALSALGWEGDQTDTARVLKPNYDDKSVMPWQIVYYVTYETDYAALHRTGGTLDVLRQLVAHGFPVVLEVGLLLDDSDWVGHHVVVSGYDMADQTFQVYDSFLGNGGPRTISRSELDEAWRQFNRSFVVVYDPADEVALTDALGDWGDSERARILALQFAVAEKDANPDDAWAWFNTGAAWMALGNAEDAARTFDLALAMGLPWRTLWYRTEPYAAYFYAGRYTAVAALADTVLGTTDLLEEPFYWQGVVAMQGGTPELALESFNRALALNPNYLPAQIAVMQLRLVSLDSISQAGASVRFASGDNVTDSEDGYGVIILTPTVSAPESPSGVVTLVVPMEPRVVSPTFIPTVTPPTGDVFLTPSMLPPVTPSRDIIYVTPGVGTPVYATPIHATVPAPLTLGASATPSPTATFTPTAVGR